MSELRNLTEVSMNNADIASKYDMCALTWANQGLELGLNKGFSSHQTRLGRCG
jgi:hypothetical protein